MYLLFDIGGTKMRLAATEDLKIFSEPRISETPKNFQGGISLFKKIARELAGSRKIKAIAGGIAGTFDKEVKMLLTSPNLKGWVNRPIKRELENVFDVPVFIENDSAMAGLGEAIFGAGRGYKIIAYITLSTGVGGARVVNGKIDEKTFGFEPGHQIIDADKTLCPECEGIYLEQCVSGSAMEKRFGKKPSEINNVKIWDKEAMRLTYGLNNVIVFWSPEAVVLGGSLMNKIDIKKIRKNLKSVLKIFTKLPEIKKAELDDLGGLYGAAAFLRQKIDIGQYVNGG